MGYYTQEQLPFYYKLYDTFAISDRYFASTLTQTFPKSLLLPRRQLLVDTTQPTLRPRTVSPGRAVAPLGMAGKSIFEAARRARSWRPAGTLEDFTPRSRRFSPCQRVPLREPARPGERQPSS